MGIPKQLLCMQRSAEDLNCHIGTTICFVCLGLQVHHPIIQVGGTTDYPVCFWIAPLTQLISASTFKTWIAAVSHRRSARRRWRGKRIESFWKGRTGLQDQ